MREIEFRGQLAKSKKWVSGDLLRNYWVQGDTFVPYSIRYLIDSLYSFPMEVIPETIGQYTGLKDKNGTKIFEGDILGGYPHGNVVVKWNDEWACFESYSTEIHFDEDGEPFEKDVTSLFSNDLKDCFNEWIILGNIHDNPELLKGE